jgi:hypothetical protein
MFLNMFRASLCSSSGGQLYIYSIWYRPILYAAIQLECFLERTFCDGAQFSCRIFLNLRVFKKRPNFLNSSPTSTQGALRLLSAPSGRF